MDLVAYVVMPIQKNNRTYMLSLPFGAPFEDVHAVLEEINANVKQMEDNQKQKAEQQSQQAEVDGD